MIVLYGQELIMSYSLGDKSCNQYGHFSVNITYMKATKELYESIFLNNEKRIFTQDAACICSLLFCNTNTVKTVIDIA